MNCNLNKINAAIGCNVCECKFNCAGKNCTLDHINVCECTTGSCTYCKSFIAKE